MNTSKNVVSVFVGIDVSKSKLDCALLCNGKIKSKVVRNDRSGFMVLNTWLQERSAVFDGTHLCMEATGPYSEQAALALVEFGWIVSVVNPARIKGFAQSELARNKTDRNVRGRVLRCHQQTFSAIRDTFSVAAVYRFAAAL